MGGCEYEIYIFIIESVRFVGGRAFLHISGLESAERYAFTKTAVSTITQLESKTYRAYEHLNKRFMAEKALMSFIDP